jgi:hypothetical protein
MMFAKDPELAVSEVRARIIETGDAVGLPDGIPRLNACRALGACP